MAKKKNSKKKSPKVDKVIDQKIQEQAEEVTESEVIEEFAAAEVPEETPVDAVDEVADAVEGADQAADAIETTATDSASASDPDSEPEAPQEPETEVTDFTLVMEPVGSSDAGEPKPIEPDNTVEEAPSAPIDAVGEEPSAPVDAVDEEPAHVATTALATLIPAAAVSEEAVQADEPKKKKNKGSFFSKPVTGKILAAALAAALILNGAVTAGIMALYTKSIRNDITEVNKAVGELDEELSSGSQDNGFGMMPPDWNSDDNGWNYYDWYGNDRDSDDWDDDWYGGGNSSDDWNSAPYEDQQNDQQGQRSSSGVSIGIVISDDNGVTITQVTGKNAQKAGFETGDKIISFDGKNVSDSNGLISEVQKHSSGDKVKVVVERSGKKVTIDTELE